MGIVRAKLTSYPIQLKTITRFKNGQQSINVVDQVFTEYSDLKGSYKSLPKEDKVCQYEGCIKTEELEAHHINPQISIKRKDLTPYEKSIISKKRKIVTLCRKHHMMLHRRRLFVS